MRWNGAISVQRGAALLFLLLLLPLAVRAQDSGKLEAEARKAFDSGRFKEAGEKFAQAAARSSEEEKADLHIQSAWSYYIAGNTRAAREALKAAFSARPQLEVIAEFYSPDFSRLAQSVRAEISGAVPSPALTEAKRAAREKLDQGKPEEALADLKGLEASPDPQVHRLLAEAYDRLGRAAEADTARRRASEAERAMITSSPIGAGPSSGLPGSVPAINAASLIEAAENALRAGDARVAEALARRALEGEPRNAEAHRLAADAALALDQDADAERGFTAAVALDSGNARAELGLAKVAERQKKWNTAASHYRRSLELNPRNVGAARGLGRSMDALGDSTGARLAYGRAIETDPSDASARNDFGVFLFRAGELDRAMQELIEAVRLEPQRAVLHENLGRAFRKKGMRKESERELADAARLAPNEKDVWTLLGHLRAERKAPEEAATAYASAFHLDPANEEAASGLGAVLAEAGKLAEAETALVKALEANPKSAVLWNNLGVVRTRRGTFGGAVEAFQKAIALDANLEAAKSNLLRAQQLFALERAAS